jgi:hypothetical protein
MPDSRRTVESLGLSRRVVRGSGGQVPAEIERVTASLADGKSAQWASLPRRLGCDRPRAEAVVWAMVDAGLAEVDEVRDRKGDWRPIRWRLTIAGVAQATPRPDRSELARREAQAFLDAWPQSTEAIRAHPVLQAIVRWLEEAQTSASSRAIRTVLATARHLAAGRVPVERVLAVEVAGDSKALRIDDLRDELARAFGRPVEQVIRRHAEAALAFGSFSFTVGAHRIDASWSHPWLALTGPTLRAMQNLKVGDTTLVTIENLTCFESYVAEGLPCGGIALWTGGFVGEAERQLIDHLVQAGVRRVRHWGDLDPDGLAIMRHVSTVAGVPVEALRMDAKLLDTLPSRPLTDREVLLLDAWIADPASPSMELAKAMRERGRKVEQEAWYVRDGNTVAVDDQPRLALSGSDLLATATRS